MKTRRDAEHYVTTAIESNGAAKAEEFNLEAIIDELRDHVGDYTFADIDEDTFWNTIRKHDNSAK